MFYFPGQFFLKCLKMKLDTRTDVDFKREFEYDAV